MNSDPSTPRPNLPPPVSERGQYLRPVCYGGSERRAALSADSENAYRTEKDLLMLGVDPGAVPFYLFHFTLTL